MFGTPKGTTIVENAVTTNTGEQQTVTETILPVEIAGQATEIVSVTEGNETFLAETTTEAAVAENASGTIQTREVLSAYIENTSEEKESFIYKIIHGFGTNSFRFNNRYCLFVGNYRIV
jgi:hypothetical protein